ncbi:hypothetical protein D1164_02510 [Mariniphaga sediminis]|uniref:Nitrate reductase molybdenum cofactor assembly chaperone n=1 Tax=Mariniphaga sediminis TaxID=1628158 RepID=A0A399D4C1_9BACT|nr:hypothetical protein [Mariniphaga sediminis]RIH64220.1 hypothetical protein D1164_15460 [Mariniphaga sediminis]RIH66499.1 hypothetical protein D1164_02510 [Mariniphaga sediminis]
MKDLTHYTDLAAIFRYPTPKRESFIGVWRKIIWNGLTEQGPKLEMFITHVQEKTIAAQQEYYISTFDVQAVCYLDIGYVLYGEDYNRGIFLANMKKEQENAGNDCGSELPDHLPNMLTLLPKLGDQNLAEELVVSIMIPALEKMIESFQATDNVYKGMLEVLLNVMKNDYPASEFERFNFSSQEKARSFECLPQWRNIK